MNSCEANSSLDRSKLIKFGCAVVVSGCVGLFGHRLMVGQELPLNIMSTVFSILAAFFLTVTTLVADPTNIPPGSWKYAETYRTVTMPQVAESTWLFYTYLFSLGLLICSSFSPLRIPQADHSEVSSGWYVVDGLTLGVCAFALLCSSRLPVLLRDMQDRKITRIIEERRRSENLPD